MTGNVAGLLGGTVVEIRLLGEVVLLARGRPIDLGPPRQRCVWAALAVDAGRVVPVERLLRRVWGDDPPLRARGTLLTYLSRLRRAVTGVASLTRRCGGYVLQVDGAAVDLHRFRALRAGASTEDLVRALELWRGDPLTGVPGDWAEAERDRLRQEQLTAQHDLVDAALRAGGGEELVAELSARAAEHPLDERVAAQYLLALHRAGRTADALAHHRRVRDLLVEQLGTEPGAPLRELHGRILDADPALTAAVRPPLVDPAEAPARHHVPAGEPPTDPPVVAVPTGAGTPCGRLPHRAETHHAEAPCAGTHRAGLVTLEAHRAETHRVDICRADIHRADTHRAQAHWSGTHWCGTHRPGPVTPDPHDAGPCRLGPRCSRPPP